MAISDSQKLDFLWKKLGYGFTKTETNSNKLAINESIASPLLLRGDNIWSQSGSIPSVQPGSSSSLVTVYPTSTPLECTNDGSASPNRTWLTGVTNWISPEFGATFIIKVYIHTSGDAANAASSGTQVLAAGSGNNDEWFFDYQSGVLNFNGINLPNGVNFSGKSVYIAGAVYNGGFGIGIGTDAQNNHFGIALNASSFDGTATDNVLFGHQAGYNITSGDKNVVIGSLAGNSLNSGSNHVIIGYDAGGETNGTGDVAIGYEALQANTGDYNTALGYQSGGSSGSDYGVYLGYRTGGGVTGDHNIAVGFQAIGGNQTTSGNSNICMGVNSGNSITSGSYNLNFGAYSGLFNTDGQENICVGFRAGQTVTNGDYNIFLGAYAGYNFESTSSRNIAIGRSSATGVTGSDNTIIGNLEYPSGTVMNGQVAIGAGATELIRINSTGVGIGTTNPTNAALHIEGRNLSLGGPGYNSSGESNLYLGDYDAPANNTYDPNIRVGTRGEFQFEIESDYGNGTRSNNTFYASPDGLGLNIYGDSSSPGPIFYYNYSRTAADQYFYLSANSKYLWFDGDTGRLGVNRGTGNGWTDTLDVNGSAKINGNLTVDAGTNSTITVKCDDTGSAGIRLYGDSQGTGYVEVGQSSTYGGGMSYNGDNSPAFVSGESSDNITFYRMDNGTRTEVFSYPYNSNTVTFNGTVSGTFSGNGANVTNVNATTLDSIDSGSFLRSDAGDTSSQRISFQANATNNWDTIATSSGSQGSIEVYNSGSGNDAFMSFHTGSDYALYFGLDADTNDLSVGGWSMGANKYRVWHAGNDGSGSGLDADLLDGAQPSVSAGNNTIVKRHSSGYIFANYFNTTPNDVTSGVTKVCVETGDDGYIRHGSAGAIRSFINVENGATADQTASEILTAIKTVDGSGSGLDADTLDGINSGSFLRSDANDTASGTLTFNGLVNIRGNMDLADNDILRFGTGDDCELFCNGSHMYMDLNSGIGNFYIRDGTTTRFTFDDSGAFTATGNITAYSDISLKKNIELIPNALDKVLSLRGVTYNRTDIENEPKQSGVIAQEVEKVLPEVVSTDEEGIKSVAYGNMVGLLIEAIKEQQQQIDELKRKLEEK